MQRFLLASASPRRRELLKAAGFAFDWEDPGDEGAPEANDPAELVLAHARCKCAASAARHPGRVVLAADTLVWVDERPLGKPADREEAESMLRGLAERVHEVWTGVCVVNGKGGSWEKADRARVVFGAIPAAELEAYLAGREWADKAGAYGIQGAAGAWARLEEGDYETVVGLSTATAAELLHKAGACPEALED